jgi:hypothetical protein
MMTIDVKLGISWTILSFGMFLVCRHFARLLAALRLTNKNKDNVPKPYIRTWFTYSNDEQWERVNLIISCLHSVIMSISVIYSYWVYSPGIYRDLVNHLTYVTYLTCCTSFGRLK